MPSLVSLVRSQGVHGECLAVAHLRLQLGDIVFGDGEDHGDGLHLRDDHQGGGAGGRGQVAGIDQAQTDAAGDGRGDVGKAQLHLVDIAPCPGRP